ncbi:5-formyltetrahydrofolate cyclo-ligase [Candidatus Omnitrophota bacterium]
MKEKEVLRKKMKAKINSQDKSERRKKSIIIQKKLFGQKEFLVSSCVMPYVSKGTGEVETGPIIKKALKMGKSVVLPVTLAKRRRIKPVLLRNLKQGLKKSTYGIYEPIETKSAKPIRKKEIDLVIVPGLAFDRKKNRLGRGQGYYDGFLKSLPKNTPKIGLGFRFQLFKKIPATKNDFSLNRIITN